MHSGGVVSSFARRLELGANTSHVTSPARKSIALKVQPVIPGQSFSANRVTPLDPPLLAVIRISPRGGRRRRRPRPRRRHPVLTGRFPLISPIFTNHRRTI